MELYKLPDYIAQGSASRLFPVLSDTSKEGRALSIFLACFTQIEELQKALLSTLGVRVGVRSKIQTYTEVCFKDEKNKKNSIRPDGLIVIANGKKEHRILVEAKVGNNNLTKEQVEAYLELASQQKIDAVLTITNDYVALPEHHPIEVNKKFTKKIGLFHWSWAFILTQVELLISQSKVSDAEQSFILNEFKRFIEHDSTGIRHFDKMPSSWADACRQLQSRAKLKKSDKQVEEVVAAWHQEAKDISLILSRMVGYECPLKMSRKHASDPLLRVENDIQQLCDEEILTATIAVPDAAAPVEIKADVVPKSISVSMKIEAPKDKKSAKARTSWVLRQLNKIEPSDIEIRAFWPGGKAYTQKALVDLRDDVSLIDPDNSNLAPTSFEVIYYKYLGGSFNGTKKFIEEIEMAVATFYERVGENLKKWQSPAPKIKRKVEEINPDLQEEE